jgi:hypothetical protein
MSCTKGNMMMKRTSSKKIDANRRNAQRSTGPKTVKGKKRVSTNPLRHGLLSRAVVIQNGYGKENRADYDRMLEDHIAELKPVGVIEEMLVDRIASNRWREARVKRYETGVIRNQLEQVRIKEERRRNTLFRRHLEIVVEDVRRRMKADLFEPIARDASSLHMHSISYVIATT